MVELIPSPTTSTLSIGPLTIHFYALCIITGIAVAIWLGRWRYANLGGNPDEVSEVAIWAVPFGIIGGRIYHVISSPQQYFGENGNPVDALRIWQGGLGIWGAISLGAIGAYVYFKTHTTTLSFAKLLDSLAPGVIIAQAIGRIGNYFNQEVFGKPTTLPWALEIEAKNRPVGYEEFATFHPTFLYELLWCLLIAFLLIKLPGFLNSISRNPGDIFALYIAGYTAGRFWIEALRIDEANYILGLRLNIWVSIIVFASAVIYLYRSKRGVNRVDSPEAS
ncbi:prolipoprotein diacylglyceryl transferase [Candidatus Nanopelagicus hibericus]|jgi:prolipoprotein diacylglyceryl transferase|uniref:Phosphatidylglycerol--prolipoprotein diacylglyceryl transferase n=1 Tax=Candidatus Nanopelagicus hibericus TaxID=1884915 RepID=A0A249K9F2_9ACTN|nr:prolipoprotein diacylglyceryl transferase [Candidatus Nanopelagicus hibericus]ASY13411.1 prolipoprotein diacylglyceryl transferase [Candidatus Nanopelagicus hibericus]